MTSDKPHRIRVRVVDGKPRVWNQLKGQLGSYLDVIGVKDHVEFVICAVKEAHLEKARAKLAAVGLEEMPGGDTTVATPLAASRSQNRPTAPGDGASKTSRDFRKKPYGFVGLPEQFTSAPSVWHDGTSAEGRLSGELRCEIEALTPLLVGWERRQLNDRDEAWPIPWPVTGDRVEVPGVGKVAATKSVLCPLRAPWGNRPAIIPGDSLKGLLRHELGALLGAPMERVAERSYSYRPNAMFPSREARLIPRLARIPTNGGVKMRALDSGGLDVRVPTRLELLAEDLKYDKQRKASSNWYRFDEGSSYRGGLGAGQRLNSKRGLHRRLAANPSTAAETTDVPDDVQDAYLATLRHLTNLEHGHFGERHPDVPKNVTGEGARKRILEAAAKEVFQPGDMIWVEWDKDKKRIVSVGWHYYYRWTYTDTVRRKGGHLERHGLFPLPEERETDDAGAPKALSAVRRLFGYTGDTHGSKGIGKDSHSQLMGRVSLNSAIEVVQESESDNERFLPPTFLKELGMPRPSAVEHYLEQPQPSRHRPSDRASLVTYGDAHGYDEPGKLAGRKFYLDRKDAYTDEPWKDDSVERLTNDRSTLALEASRPGRKFRFTVRFRDLDALEVANLMIALCPHQFRDLLRGPHPDGYCSKLGYGRPLGWGSIRIEAKALLFVDVDVKDLPKLSPVANCESWLREHHGRPPPLLVPWLGVHRHKHPDADDYPKKDGQIHAYHTSLRAEHARDRRDRPERPR